ncbi:PREDICTED: probable transcription factor RL9 [Camelina sativa]|uniref:Probable transcription factor RL9 n=1 Tax=Camelina sativa TaxID=90675 RepID=A0ABM0WCX9_CAMSA|nr:PREDICTED: probable transcription factor RL9 [Camelina sativa]
MSRWTSDLHCQFVNTVEELGGERDATPRSILEHMNESRLAMSEERHARLREIIQRQTQLHFRQYERHQKIVDNNIQNPQRQEEKMDKSTIEVGELSSGTQEISCKGHGGKSARGVSGHGGRSSGGVRVYNGAREPSTTAVNQASNGAREPSSAAVNHASNGATSRGG